MQAVARMGSPIDAAAVVIHFLVWHLNRSWAALMPTSIAMVLER